MSGRYLAGHRLTHLISYACLSGALTGCSLTGPQRVDHEVAGAAPATPSAQAEVGAPELVLKERAALELNRMMAFSPVGGPMPASAQAPEREKAQQHEDVWSRIRAGFAMPLEEHEGRPRVQRERRWFARHPSYFDRVTERARPYLHYLVEEAERRDLPLELTLMPIIESAFQPFAYSPSHAAGIWQFVPGTARKYGLKRSWWYDGRRDIVESTRAAFDYLERLHAEFEGDWLLAVAAYNCGEGNVHRAIRRNVKAGKPRDFWSLRLPRETRHYVPRLLAVASIVAHPDRYPISLEPIPNEPHFERIALDGQIELGLAADLAEMPLEDFYLLNPAFNRWATDPDGPHHLLVPVDAAQSFRERIAEVPTEQRVAWQRHRIREGETLGRIARRYGTRVSVLQELNDLRGTLIRAGADLIVPAPGQRRARYAKSSEQDSASTTHVHLVRRGDTLWQIAKRYRVPMESLAAWNGLHRTSVLRVGQRLTVRGASVNTGSGAVVTPAVVKGLATQRVVYRVRPGDSLWRIARRFNVRVSSLRSWNGIRRGEYLHPGQRLRVYVDPRRYAGPS
ncbi:MAG: LysM peptidoglycan-binding domain-containing protein [Gammaproteobacteria bacterium]|nr:LysM peptidoglycan-binding domain-containing protein [Gammaproteobacteria bacterium]NIR82862.1 LysM peptidoglycan-binding domain-containing protein [Gammaproteobacteria bacterium]NIR89971.1 LysM peptidoglycan-binding domain-containing protein [Gammaproteobacteria bacterium]NIU04020.1 LysM peptidoglycan-binding domain-containing protein [Gammaproteobacteria bacterium]NIV51340.1 LysM peptidoglycan-binding domain-containing protein [Gammaproteobacteria bacterium]